MGLALISRTGSSDAVPGDLREAPQPARARTVDVDDVRELLKELRLRRQLRAEG